MDERAAVTHAASQVEHWDGQLREAIVAAYRSGAVGGLRELGTLAGWAPESVRKLLRDRGVELQGRGRPRSAAEDPPPSPPLSED